MIHPTDKDIGRSVAYFGGYGEVEFGILVSVPSKGLDAVFVRYGRCGKSELGSKLTSLYDMEWAD